MLKNKNIYLLSMASLWSVGALAQSSLLPAKPKATNYVELLMMSIAILLVVVIGGLGNVLLMVSKKAVEISKSSKKIMMIFVVVMGSLFSKSLYGQATTVIADTTSKINSTAFYGGLSYNTFWTMTVVLALELLIIALLVLFIRNIFRAIHPKEIEVVNGKKVTASWLLKTWHYLDKMLTWP